MNFSYTSMKKFIAAFTALLLIFSVLTPYTAFAEEVYEESIEEKIERVAKERGVPAVILKSIAQIESSMAHFYNNGDVKVSRTGNLGLMQVGNSHGMFDTERLKYDIDYNLEAGIEILLMKWSSSVQNYSISSVGNMDPNILENWYFAIWAYNGWASSNNPISNSKAYQTRVYEIAKEQFGQDITPIDMAYLPYSGKPAKKLNVPTPENSHSANLYQFKVGDIVSVNSILNDRVLCATPGNTSLAQVYHGEVATVLEAPVLHEGYYWYKVQTENGMTGWIQRNWIKKIGDSVNGIYPFEDITYHWSVNSIMNLYNSDIISDRNDNMYSVDELMTKEEYFALLAKTLDSFDEESELYGVTDEVDKDETEIDSDNETESDDAETSETAKTDDENIDEDRDNETGKETESSDSENESENAETLDDSDENDKTDDENESKENVDLDNENIDKDAEATDEDNEVVDEDANTEDMTDGNSTEKATDLRFLDSNEISSWSLKYIEYLDDSEVLDFYTDYLDPKDAISRGEITELISNILIEEARLEFNESEILDESEELSEDDEDKSSKNKKDNNEDEGSETDIIEFNHSDVFNLDSIELEFKDIETLTDNQIESIKILTSLGIMHGENSENFGYNDLLSKGEAAAATYKLQKLLSDELTLAEIIEKMKIEKLDDIENSENIDEENSDDSQNQEEVENQEETEDSENIDKDETSDDKEE